ncbi:MAG TPA: threonine/serine exporter family protein [Clostridia bacterium]|nr:threonine/serine exporter family protein [Clostridia bacterium]
MIEYIKNFSHAYISTVGFAIIFNTPKSALIKSGFAGGLGWVIYTLTRNLFGSVMFSTFIASMSIALIGEYFAIIDKNPITIYIIPGIIPLVPGFGLYNTMLSIVEKQFDKVAEHGSETLMISMAIAGALVIVLSINSYRRKGRGPC